jgi:tetratricopeptide (TPR) repeat protein
VTPRARVRIALLAAALSGFSPFEAEEENVRAGNARLREGDAAEARRRYDAAERAVGPRPEIEFDRGHAAMAEGRVAEAAEAFGRAAEGAPPKLASRALQNRGTALAASGDREGALRDFARALEQDPANEDARWNLEVLLREARRPGANPRGDEGEDGRGAEGKREGAGAPPPSPKGDPSPSAPAAPAEPAAPAPDRARGAPPEAAAGDAGDAARRGAEEGDARRGLSRQEAEALLDALRAGERQMPLFGPERKGAGRRDAAKDW